MQNVCFVHAGFHRGIVAGRAANFGHIRLACSDDACLQQGNVAGGAEEVEQVQLLYVLPVQTVPDLCKLGPGLELALCRHCWRYDRIG